MTLHAILAMFVFRSTKYKQAQTATKGHLQSEFIAEACLVLVQSCCSICPKLFCSLLQICSCSEVVVFPCVFDSFVFAFVFVSLVFVFVFVSFRLSEVANHTGADTERPCRVTLCVRDAPTAIFKSSLTTGNARTSSRVKQENDAVDKKMVEG